MTARWRRLRLRDVALFVAVAGLVAVLGVAIGRELGIGQQTGASVASSPAEETTALTLTLSARKICETKRGEGFVGPKWANVAEIPVRWEVTGGTGPYTLVIDNEPRDGFGPYEGASGTASVSCAPNPGKVTYNDYDQHRWYQADPEIDSGPKTIRATVTDANSATANASVGIYVILKVTADLYVGPDGTPVHHRFNKGRTYRFNGFLMTFPSDAFSSSSTEDSFTIKFFLDGHRGSIHIGDSTGSELGRRIEPYRRKTDFVRGESEYDDPEAALNSFLTELVESFGQPPAVTSP